MSDAKGTRMRVRTEKLPKMRQVYVCAHISICPYVSTLLYKYMTIGDIICRRREVFGSEPALDGCWETEMGM